MESQICWNAAVADAGRRHVLIAVGGLEPRDLPEFKWVNTVLGNLRTTLTGPYHSLKYRKYAADDLAAFAYRFNRRVNLRDLVEGLIVDVARTAPVKARIVRARADAGWQSAGSSRFIFAQPIRNGC